jgi:hypothetical protein
MNRALVPLPEARAAWTAIEPKLRRRRVFSDGPGGGAFELRLLCNAFGLDAILRRLAARRRGRARRLLLQEAEEARLTVREFASRFFDLIPATRVPIAPLDADGEDAEIRSWFTGEKTSSSPKRREPLHTRRRQG